MVIYVDIDETICESPENRDYNLATPIVENIQKINDLFEQGHRIIYWTARGSGTGIDWKKCTRSQFDKWNVKYDRLFFGKPIYDIFICDKAVNSISFFWEKK